jgi:hypothetical protein
MAAHFTDPDDGCPLGKVPAYYVPPGSETLVAVPCIDAEPHTDELNFIQQEQCLSDRNSPVCRTIYCNNNPADPICHEAANPAQAMAAGSGVGTILLGGLAFAAVSLFGGK